LWLFSSIFHIIYFGRIVSSKIFMVITITDLLCEQVSHQFVYMTLYLLVLTQILISYFCCRVGGSMPVIFAYYTEFQSKDRRGSMISLLATFWMCGNIVAAGTTTHSRTFNQYIVEPLVITTLQCSWITNDFILSHLSPLILC
jgi:hypothetical protein